MRKSPWARFFNRVAGGKSLSGWALDQAAALGDKMRFRPLADLVQRSFHGISRFQRPTKRTRRFVHELGDLEARIALSNTAPVFSQASYVFEVPSGTSTVGSLPVTDAEGDMLSFTADNSNFYIDSYTGTAYFYGTAVAGSTHSTTVTVSDGQSTTSALVTVNFTGQAGYGETEQTAQELIDDEYFAAQEDFYNTVNDYTYSSNYYYSEPDYGSALQDSPLGDMTSTFGNQVGNSDYYDQLANQTQQNAGTQEQIANTTQQPGPGADTTGGGGAEDPDDTDLPEIDPRLQWTAFSFTDETGFPDVSIPAQALLDDLFSWTPTGTESFSSTTLTESAPVIETGVTDALSTTKQTGRSTSVTSSQDWVSPSEWTLTQSITKSLGSTETGEHDEGADDTIVRTGYSTLTISVINGTSSTVTYTIFDSFSYSKGLEWDREPEEEGTGGTEEGEGELALGASPDGDEEDGPVDKGNFNSSFQSTASMTVTLTTVLITLPDGRLARQYTFGYSTLTTFSSSFSGSAQVKKGEGTLKEFEEEEDELPTMLMTQENGEPDGEPEVDEDEPNLTVEPGGNGSSVDFSGSSNYNDNFSKNFGLNLSATVADGESLDDAEVTGTGEFGVSTDYSLGGSSTLNIQLQTSSDDPATGDGGHEYISYNSNSNGNQSADFSFDIEFDVTDDDSDPTGTPADGTTFATPSFNPDGTPAVPPADPPPAPNFEFTYSTGNNDGGGGVLLYSKSSTLGPRTTTETLTASGNFTASFTFDFGVLSGITVGVVSSGNGNLTYKSTTVSDHGPPDFSQPAEWYGAWHYPQFRDELTVTNNGSFSADVTLTFSLLSGLGVDASYTASFTTVTKELSRTDWAYWETAADGTNTYNELGHGETVTTATQKFSGNLDDGFKAEVDIVSTFTSDVVFQGTKGTGQPPPENVDEDLILFNRVLDGIQLALDIGGMVPALGEPLDAINAGISLGRGNYKDAALSIAAMVPIGGQAVTGAKLTNKAGAAIAKNLDKADEAAAGLSKLGDEFKEAVEQYGRQAPDVPKVDVPCKGGATCFIAGTPVLVHNSQLKVTPAEANAGTNHDALIALGALGVMIGLSLQPTQADRRKTRQQRVRRPVEH